MMRAVLIVAIAGVVGGLVSASMAETARDVIRVEVVGLRNADGDIKCALFTNADGFPTDSSKAVKTTSAQIQNGSAECDFDHVSPGDYGVSVYHDENSNGKLERNFMGIPKEGVGASNDAAGTFGPPKFDDARFTYSGGTKVMTVHIRYLTAPF